MLIAESAPPGRILAPHSSGKRRAAGPPALGSTRRRAGGAGTTGWRAGSRRIVSRCYSDVEVRFFIRGADAWGALIKRRDRGSMVALAAQLARLHP